MNILTYNGVKYRIIHTINENTTFCSAIIALEAYASDLQGHIARSNNLKNIYQFTPIVIGEYKRPYNTQRITYQGKTIGYWDFPIPPQYSRFMREANLTEDMALFRQQFLTTYKMVRHAERIMAGERHSTDPFFESNEEAIHKLYKQNDWDGLDLLFGRYARHEMDADDLQLRLNQTDITIDALTYPKISALHIAHKTDNPASIPQPRNLNEVPDSIDQENKKESLTYQNLTIPGTQKNTLPLTQQEFGVVKAIFESLFKGELPTEEILKPLGKCYISTELIHEINTFLGDPDAYMEALNKDFTPTPIKLLFKQLLSYTHGTQPDSPEITGENQNQNALIIPKPALSEITNIIYTWGAQISKPAKSLMLPLKAIQNANAVIYGWNATLTLSKEEEQAMQKAMQDGQNLIII